MRNNKGFTLIELLIIIVIISIIIGITIPSILLINNKVVFIVSAAEIYGSENNEIFYGTNIAKVYVGELINENYLESEKECSVYITIDDGSTIFTKGCIYNPIDNNDMNNNYVILLRQASSDNNTYNYIGYFNREGYNFEENINSNSYAVLIYLKNGNNVEGNMNTKTYKINDSVVLDNNKFTREGYDFIGWCTTVKCENDKLLKPLDTVTNLVRNDYARSYIYAEWEAKEYNINYNLDNGILLKQNPTYYTTESEFKLNNPIKSGYRFIGWIENEGDTPKEIFNVFKGTIGDKTFTAIYELDNYTLTLDCGSGVGSSVTNTYNANETPILSSIGCYFVDELNNNVYYQTGWSNEYGNYDMDSKYTFYSNGNNEIKLTATWNKLFDITGNYVVVDEKNGNWKVKILGSENNTFGKASIVFNIETNIDLFLVGGGAGGRFYYLDWDTKIRFPCFGAG